MRIAIALFEDAEELDWAGPWEVLATWARHWPADGVEVVTVADSAAPVRCANGLRVLADLTWEDLGPIDVLVYPGGIGTRPQLGRPELRARMRGLAAAGTLSVSLSKSVFCPTRACSTAGPRRRTGVRSSCSPRSARGSSCARRSASWTTAS